MRVAIISDMHGNCVALDAVLADLQHDPTDRIVCLGDAIQGGPQPAETVARLRELACPVVMGNADAWLLTGQRTSSEPVSPEQEAVRAWSLAQLSDAARAFIAGFQPTITLPLGSDRQLLCFHGSPHSFDDIIHPETSEEEFTRLLGPFAPALMCGGHTHLQQVRRLGDGFFFNPGSVGVAYNRHQPEESFQLDPWAEYAVLTAEVGRLRLEFRRVPFDVDALLAALQASGRPHPESTFALYGRAYPPA
jgi:predicted phosphodiesterase